MSDARRLNLHDKPCRIQRVQQIRRIYTTCQSLCIGGILDPETGLQWPRRLFLLLFFLVLLSDFPSTKAFSFHDRSSSNFAHRLVMGQRVKIIAKCIGDTDIIRGCDRFRVRQLRVAALFYPNCLHGQMHHLLDLSVTRLFIHFFMLTFLCRCFIT